MTLVGRAQLDHPALGAAGGSALHASIESIYTNISDDLFGRYSTYSAIANSTVTTIAHNYGVPFADLKVYLYTGTYPAFTRVSDPAASGWTIAATSGFLQTKIDVTAPSSGGPHTFAVFIAAGRGAEKLKDLDDINTTAPLDGQLLIYDSGTSKWIPSYEKYKSETAAIASNTVTPTTGATIQRLTSGAADLQMIASPVAGKLYVVINELGSSIQVKNDTGATAANRIYTGTGADFTLKNQAAISLIYDSGLSRWILAGGAGGGGLAPLPAAATITTAVAGTHYLTNTSGGAFIATLPAGIAGSVIMFTDANETWQTNNLTITPASGEKIDNLATNESLVCDVQRGWVELSWNSALSSWTMRAIASTLSVNASASVPGVVSTGTQTFAGDKTFNGLVTPLSGIVGRITGTAIAAGAVGEMKEPSSLISATTATTSESDVTNASITLTAGVWEIKYSVMLDYTTGSTSGNNGFTSVVITDNANTHIGRTERAVSCLTRAAATNSNDCPASASWIVNISASTTYKLRLKRVDSAGTGSGSLIVSAGVYDSTFYAVRIA